MKNMLGRKIGMTQIFKEDGSVVPVTVIQAGPLYVVQKKTVEKDGYNAIQVGYADIKERRVNKPTKGHFDKADLEYKKIKLCWYEQKFIKGSSSRCCGFIFTFIYS